jgi:hypothetical protein
MVAASSFSKRARDSRATALSWLTKSAGMQGRCWPVTNFEDAQRVATEKNVATFELKCAMTGGVAGGMHHAWASGQLDDLSVGKLVDGRDGHTFGHAISQGVEEVAVEERPESLA